MKKLVVAGFAAALSLQASGAEATRVLYSYVSKDGRANAFVTNDFLQSQTQATSRRQVGCTEGAQSCSGPDVFTYPTITNGYNFAIRFVDVGVSRFNIDYANQVGTYFDVHQAASGENYVADPGQVSKLTISLINDDDKVYVFSGQNKQAIVLASNQDLSAVDRGYTPAACASTGR